MVGEGTYRWDGKGRGRERRRERVGISPGVAIIFVY